MQKTQAVNVQNQPWYKQFWPWFIIALPASAVVASFFTLWLAVSNPDHIVLNDEEYQALRRELKAQDLETEQKIEKSESSQPDSR